MIYLITLLPITVKWSLLWMIFRFHYRFNIFNNIVKLSLTDTSLQRIFPDGGKICWEPNPSLEQEYQLFGGFTITQIWSAWTKETSVQQLSQFSFHTIVLIISCFWWYTFAIILFSIFNRIGNDIWYYLPKNRNSNSPKPKFY